MEHPRRTSERVSPCALWITPDTISQSDTTFEVSRLAQLGDSDGGMWDMYGNITEAQSNYKLA